MTTAVPVAVLAVVSGCAAWAMWRAGAGLTTAAATATVALLLAVELITGAAGAEGLIALRIAVFVAAPLMLLTYPSVAAARMVPVTVTVVLVAVAAGVASCLTPVAHAVAGAVVATGSVVHLGSVIDRGDRSARTAALWLSAALGFAGMAALLFTFGYNAVARTEAAAVPAAVVTLLACLVPTAAAVGVMRPDVVDVRWLVTRIVVTLTVLACFVAAANLAIFALGAGGADDLDTASVIAVCAVLSLLVTPVGSWLSGTVENLLFGGRPDPVHALAAVADALGDDLAAALQALGTALTLPHLALAADGAVLASVGEPTPYATVFRLDLGDGRTAGLTVGHRAGDRTWEPADRNVLAVVAALLARSLRLQLLAEQLASSRAAEVTAIEDERRRIRRDLHDGLGPTLTGVAFAADAARNLLAADPGRADALLQRLRADTGSAIAEIRRVVDGLRPPALDELGLEGALRNWAAGMSAAGGPAIGVHFDTAGADDALPAATESVAYRITVEALTNAIRHSGASAVSVTVTHDRRALTIEVIDDGVGGTWLPGTGLTAMREHAEAVGGSVTASDGRVRALLPTRR